MGRVTLGRTGLSSSRLALGASYGIGEREVERAFDRGINFFWWGALPRPSFGRGVRTLARKHRDDIIVALHASTFGFNLRRAVERELRYLRIDCADALVLGWRDQLPAAQVLAEAAALIDSGKVKHVAISCHHRPSFREYMQHELLSVFFVRYNAAHRGAEEDVFPHFTPGRRPGVLAYTATRWATLLDPKLTPEGLAPARASECYRFCLSHPAVDVVTCGPRDSAELEEALVALDLGPLDDEEMDRMRRIGRAVYEAQPSRAAMLLRGASRFLARRSE